MKRKNTFSIDNFVNNKELNIMKAVLPFLPPQTQRFMAIFIAMNELSSVFALLNAIGNGNLFSNNKCEQEPDVSKIFETIKKFLDPSEVEMYENYLNMMNTIKMFNEMSSMFNNDEQEYSDGNNSSNSGGFNMDMLKAMLSPEQSAIFDSLSNK